MNNPIELRKVMASMETEPAKRMKIFVNGDSRFLGKDMVVNRRSIRTWDSFLQNVTNDLGNHEAIRSICTPIGGTRVRSLEELQDRSNYVALGSGPFKKIGYLNLHQRQQPKFSRSPRLPVKQYHDDGRYTDRSQNNIVGRLRDAPFDTINIFVYANGQPLDPARRVNIPSRVMSNWEAVLEEVNHRVPLGTSIKSLYTLEGFLINNPEFLENGVYYVAVGTEFGGFKKANYGVLGRPSFRLPGKLDRRHPGYGEQMASSRRSTQPGSFSLSSRASSDSETVHSRKSYPGTTRTTHMHRFKKPASDFGSTNFYAQPSPRNTTRYEEVDYDKDEGGVFKATNRRRETHGAAEVLESKDTRIDVPIDMVEAQEIQEEDEFPAGRLNIAQQKNKLQKNPTKETTNKRPQLPVKSTDQQHHDNTSRQGNSRRQGNENKDAQPANSQRAIAKAFVDVGHGGGAAEKHLPLAATAAVADSKTNKQRQKLIPETQRRTEDSKTIKEDADYYKSNGYHSDDGSDNHGNVGRGGGGAVAKHLPLPAAVAADSKTNKQRQKLIPETQRRTEDSKTIKEDADHYHSNGYHSDDGSDNHGNVLSQKKGGKTQKLENDRGTKQSKLETKQNDRTRDPYEDVFEDHEETKTKSKKRLENGRNTIVNRHGNGYHHDDDDERGHDNGEKVRAPGKRGESKDRNEDVKEKSKKLPVTSTKITKSKNQKADEQLLREKAATKIQATYRGYRTRQQLRDARVKQLAKRGPKRNVAEKRGAIVVEKQTKQRNGGKAAAADDDDVDDDDVDDVSRHLIKTKIVVQKGKQTISQRQEQTKTNKKQSKSSPRTAYGKVENEAATKIQSAYRGYSVRKQLNTERTSLAAEKTKPRAKESSPSKQKQVNVTKKVIEADRTRKIQKNERDDLDDDEHYEQETKSYSSRKKKKDTIQKQEPEKTGKKETKTRKSIFDKLRDEAAVKIQSTYRGYKTRKDLAARRNDLGKRRTFNKTPPLQTTSLKRNNAMQQQKDSVPNTPIPIPIPRKNAASRINLQQQQPKQQQQNLDPLYDGFERQQKPSPRVAARKIQKVESDEDAEADDEDYRPRRTK